MWKWIILIFLCIYIVPIIIDTIKSKDSKRCFKNLVKKEKIVVVVILILIVIVMPSYFIGKNIILKNKVKETVKSSDIYKYVDSYETKGYKYATVNLNVNDSFSKLDDNTKLKYAKEIYSSVDSTILTYGSIDDDDLRQLVNAHKVIINASEGKYTFEYDSLEKPDGKEIREEVKNSTSNSSTSSNKNYSNTNSNISNDKKGELLAIAKDEVTKSLKSPKSADFKWGYDDYTFKTCESTTSGYTGYIVSGKVSAKNSFNAEIESSFAIQFEVSGDKYRVINCIIQ